MLLKGAALDLLVYAEPWVTVSRDTDLLVRPLPGFQAGPEERELRSALYREGIECDLNRHHDVDMNGVLPIPFARIWQDARPIDFRGQAAWVMSPEDLLISLCINSCRKRFRRLKGLFDIAETVRRMDLDWHGVAEKARAYRCGGIVLSALFATAETVGLPERCRLADLETLDWRLSPGRQALLRKLVRGFAERASAALAGDTGARSAGISVLLPYVSLGWWLGWKSLLYTVTHPPKHRPPVALEPVGLA